MSERVADGRCFRILTVVDQFTRECLCLVLTPSATLQAPMGYGVAVRKQYCTHLSVLKTGDLESGPHPQPFAPDDGDGVGTCPQYREP